MARRPRLFAPEVLYHVIVRGNQRQETFVSDGDYQAYLQRLGKYRDRYSFIVHGYCLMPNHAHLLLESSAQPLAKFMQGLQQSYSQYFNLKHHKTGHVFEGRYKAIICQKEEYLSGAHPLHPSQSRTGWHGEKAGGVPVLRASCVCSRQSDRDHRSDEGAFDSWGKGSVSEVCSRRNGRRPQRGILRSGGSALFGRPGVWGKDATNRSQGRIGVSQTQVPGSSGERTGAPCRY